MCEGVSQRGHRNKKRQARPGGRGKLRRLRQMREGLSRLLYRGKGKGGDGMKRHWYDYFWIWSILFFSLGFFNILFAWLGMLDFILPLILAVAGGNKWFCNNMCGRGQLFTLLGSRLKLSLNKRAPGWLSSKWFRYGFLAFFMAMFANTVFQTYLVAAGGESLREAVKLLWTFNVPWGWTYTAGMTSDWIAQFSFDFYSLMLTSFIIGLVMMVIFRPRTWCVFCPMGTMTQGICLLRPGGKSERSAS